MIYQQAIKNEKGELQNFAMSPQVDNLNDQSQNGLNVEQPNISQKVQLKSQTTFLKNLFINQDNIQLFRNVFELFKIMIIKATTILGSIFESMVNSISSNDIICEFEDKKDQQNEKNISLNCSKSQNLLSFQKEPNMYNSYCSTQISECISPQSLKNQRRIFKWDHSDDQKTSTYEQQNLINDLSIAFKTKFKVGKDINKVQQRSSFSFEESKFNVVFQIQKSQKITKKYVKYLTIHKIENQQYEVHRIELENTSVDSNTSEIIKIKELKDLNCLQNYCTSWLEKKCNKSGKVKKIFVYIQLQTSKKNKNLKAIVMNNKKKFIKHIFYIFTKVLENQIQLYKKGIYLQQLDMSNLLFQGKSLKINNIIEQFFTKNDNIKQTNLKEQKIQSMNNLGFLLLEMLFTCLYSEDQVQQFLNELSTSKVAPKLIGKFYEKVEFLINDLISLQSDNNFSMKEILKLQSFQEVKQIFTQNIYM